MGHQKSLPIDAAASLVDFETAKPEPTGRDIRVAVKRNLGQSRGHQGSQAAPNRRKASTEILGFDAAGVVDAVGLDVTRFKPGDEVFYAGSNQRQGTNSEFHLVDERIVGKKAPDTVPAQAAALPLTSITARELLFDRLGPQGKSRDPRTLLVIGGAGGVGSIRIQLARQLTGLTVVAGRYRPGSKQRCLDLGAHAVIDHSKPLKEQIAALEVDPVGLVASLTFTEQHYRDVANIIAPQGRFGLIDDPAEFNIAVFKSKAVSIHRARCPRVHVPDAGHDRAESSSERRRRSDRRGRAAHHP